MMMWLQHCLLGEGVYVGHMGDYKLRVCQETAEFGLDIGLKNQKWNTRGKLLGFKDPSALCNDWPASESMPCVRGPLRLHQFNE